MSWFYAVLVSSVFWAWTADDLPSKDTRSLAHASVVFVVTFFLGRISSDTEDLLKEVKKLNKKE